MRIDRKWAMPNRWTFQILPIANFVMEEHIEKSIDPFAGLHSPATVKNDLNTQFGHQYCMDAIQFLHQFPDASFQCAFYDPPYSMRQATECYKSFGKEVSANYPTSMAYWSTVKDELARILCEGGKCLCFGWNSMGLGMSRGFEMKRVLLVPHGGSRNDTICTMEIKTEFHEG